jgi:hypothetical protein
MTDEMMTLRALLGKSSDADLLREIIGFTVQRLMELEVESKTGACVYRKLGFGRIGGAVPRRAHATQCGQLRWIGRDTGASLFKDRQHIADLFVLLPGYSDLPLTE